MVANATTSRDPMSPNSDHIDPGRAMRSTAYWNIEVEPWAIRMSFESRC